MDIAYKNKAKGRGAKLFTKLCFSVVSVCVLVYGSAAWSTNLTNVEFASKEGGRFQVRLDFDGTPPEPSAYQIEKPARIALDFAGVSSQLNQKKHTLSYGNASSAVILDTVPFLAVDGSAIMGLPPLLIDAPRMKSTCPPIPL